MSTYPPPELPAASPFPDHRMAKAIAYMAERIGESVRVEQVAAACGLSTFHFSRTFKANVGKAPHGYLTHLRIEQAKVLLRSTDLQVGAVAAQVGFTRLSHFTSTFRRIMGTPPGKYRRERESA